MKKTITWALGACALLGSCDKGDEGGKAWQTGTITVADRNEMNQKLYADDSLSGFTFTAAQTWTAVVAQTAPKAAGDGKEWIRLNRYDGPAGTYTLSIGLEINRSGEARSGGIEIACGPTRVTVSVRQEATKQNGEKPEDDPIVPLPPDTTAVSIPDENFRNYLIATHRCGADGQIRQYELGAIREIDCRGRNIASLDGIQRIHGLVSLNCQDNPVAAINLSKNPQLTTVVCGNRPQEGEGKPGMTVTSLDISGCRRLKTLTGYCLDVEAIEGITDCRELKRIELENSRIASGLDLRGCVMLEEIRVYRGAYGHCPKIDASGCRYLQTLVGRSMKTLETVGVTGCRSLKTLDVSENNVRSLDLTGCSALEILNCGHNALTELDLSPCAKLSRLNCESNEIRSLDISHCPELTTADASHNRLSEIDARSNPVLAGLDVRDNRPGIKVRLLRSHENEGLRLEADDDAQVSYE